MPFTSLTLDFQGLAEENGQYLLHTNWNVLEVDQAGTATGELNTFNQLAPVVQTSVIKRSDPASGHPYFILARRVPGSNTGYRLAEYRPGIGFVHEITFADSIGSFSGLRPVLLEQPDGAFLVVGRQFYRKMRYSPDQGFTEEWVRPFGYLASHAILYGDQLAICEVSGKVALLDETGIAIWTQNVADAALWRLAPVPNGLLVCGQNLASAKALILRLDENGDELWRVETSDKIYQGITTTQDGGFVAAGTSENNQITLARFDANGNLLWQKEYGAGAGMRVLEDDAGYLVVSGSRINPANPVLIRTDPNGLAPGREPAMIRNRRIRNDDLDVTVRPGASMFSDENGATFRSAPDSAATIFAFAPLIGGLDAAGNLRTAATTYRNDSNSNYQTGPFGGQAADFNKVWRVTRDQVRALRRDFGADQGLDHPLPYDILTWPAKGNAHYQYNMDFMPVSTVPNLFTAPFTDVDGDGAYDPYKGDYPEIKGDQMIWSVMNDGSSYAGASGLGVEMQISVYAFNCPENDAIGGSLLADYKVINRSPEDYADSYLGFFTDFDIGCHVDDYMGSLPDHDAYYAYNATAMDDDCQGRTGFGAAIPVQTVQFFDRSLDRAIHCLNNSVGTVLPAMADPAAPQEYYYYLQGRWRDGTPLTGTGNGYNPGNTNEVEFAFPGNPGSPQGWTMCTAPPPQADPRMIGTHGPFDLSAGDTFNIRIGFTIHPDIPHPCPDIPSEVHPTLEQIRTWNGAGALDALPDLGQVLTLQPGQSLTLNADIPGALAYQWSNGANASGITINQPGIYTVTVTAATGCKIEEEVLVQLSTSTQDKAPLTEWTIRPNPSSEYTWIECRECPAGSGATRIVVRNAQGTALRQMETAGPILRVDAATLPAGLYWLELWQDGRYLGTKKWQTLARF